MHTIIYLYLTVLEKNTPLCVFGEAEDGPLHILHHWKTLPLAGAAVNKQGSEGVPHYHALEPA